MECCVFTFCSFCFTFCQLKGFSLCRDSKILLPGKAQDERSEHQQKRIFQSYGEISLCSNGRPWTCKVTNSSRPPPIILIQLLLVKIANLSDVCVIRNNLLLAVVENWRPALNHSPEYCWQWIIFSGSFRPRTSGYQIKIRLRRSRLQGQKHFLSYYLSKWHTYNRLLGYGLHSKRYICAECLNLVCNYFYCKYGFEIVQPLMWLNIQRKFGSHN